MIQIYEMIAYMLQEMSSPLQFTIYVVPIQKYEQSAAVSIYAVPIQNYEIIASVIYHAPKK